jgi:hypothetical protein
VDDRVGVGGRRSRPLPIVSVGNRICDGSERGRCDARRLLLLNLGRRPVTTCAIAFVLSARRASRSRWRRCGRDDPASCVPKNRADPPRPGAPGAKPEFGELEGSRAHSGCVLLRSRRVTRQLADRRRLACSLCTTRSTVVAIGETAVSCFQPARSWLTAELARPLATAHGRFVGRIRRSLRLQGLCGLTRVRLRLA